MRLQRPSAALNPARSRDCARSTGRSRCQPAGARAILLPTSSQASTSSRLLRAGTKATHWTRTARPNRRLGRVTVPSGLISAARIPCFAQQADIHFYHRLANSTARAVTPRSASAPALPLPRPAASGWAASMDSGRSRTGWRPRCWPSSSWAVAIAWSGAVGLSKNTVADIVKS